MRGMCAEAGGESKLETPIKGRTDATEAKFSSLFHFFTQMHFHAQFSLLLENSGIFLFKIDNFFSSFETLIQKF